MKLVYSKASLSCFLILAPKSLIYVLPVRVSEGNKLWKIPVKSVLSKFYYFFLCYIDGKNLGIRLELSAICGDVEIIKKKNISHPLKTFMCNKKIEYTTDCNTSDKKPLTEWIT